MFVHFGIILLLSQGLCGGVDVSEAIDGDSRIIGGQNASPGMAKYQVSIRAHSGKKEWHTCGGSIINQQYVLTAAHCIVKKRTNELSIVVGSHQIKTGGQRYKIKKLVPHEQFSKATWKNDVGVVQVEGNIKFNDNVQPIELFKQDIYVGTKCLLTGWGKVDLKKNIYPNDLQMLYFKTVSNYGCSKKLYLRESVRPGLPLNIGQLCAKHPSHKGVCHGDGGGPLVLERGNKYIQIGVVSWGVSCAEDFPDVFASVPGNYNWIQSKISD
ncbi:chymotrypsin-2-like [Pieris napi]|uniref:chymotrypsin-2-like n=1 Tax=Pieris napi TaxID=78633 RepID=UPI001FBAC096|nr:chymotrypsin-2-like [Pieris napi]